MLSFGLCGEAIAGGCVSGNTSPRPFYYQRICPLCVEEKSLSSAFTFCARTSTTRTAGDQLTLLHAHTIILYYVLWYRIICLTTRTRMVAERTAVRFDKEQDSRKYHLHEHDYRFHGCELKFSN